LAVRCTVQKSRPSSNVKVKDQGHQGQKTKKCGSLFGSGRCECGYDGGKISTCSLVIIIIIINGTDYRDDACNNTKNSSVFSLI